MMLNRKLNPREPKKRKLVIRRHIWEKREHIADKNVTYGFYPCEVSDARYLISSDDEVRVKVELEGSDDLKLLKQKTSQVRI